MKSHTDIIQSKKLAEILPVESADGFVTSDYTTIPCWSLVALMELLPYDIRGHNLVIHKSYCPNEKSFAYDLSYEGDFVDYELSILVSTSSIDLIDCCYEMILKLKERDLL